MDEIRETIKGNDEDARFEANKKRFFLIKKRMTTLSSI